MTVFLGLLFLIICILLITVILLQKGRGGGLSGAFGGVGGGSAFGARTGDVFTWVTIVLTILFLLLAIGTSLAYRQQGTVHAPLINPRGRPLTEPIKVSLEPQTKGSTIYFTRNGSEPTEKSSPYDEPFVVRPGMWVKARAFRPGWKPSAILAEHFPKAETPAPPEIPEQPETPELPAETPVPPVEAPVPPPEEPPAPPAPEDVPQPAPEDDGTPPSDPGDVAPDEGDEAAPDSEDAGPADKPADSADATTAPADEPAVPAGLNE